MSGPTFNVGLVDPGAVQRAATNDQIPIYVGVCSSGTIGEVYTFTNAAAVLSTLGTGHLVDVLLAALARHRQVKAVRVAASVAGVIDVDDASPEELVIDTITGDPLHFLAGRIECLNGTGAIAVSTGTLRVRYTLDAWDVPNVEPTWSQPVLVPSNGVIVLAHVGLTVTLDTAQTPDEGAIAEFVVEPAHYGDTDIAGLLDPLKGPLAGSYTYLVFTGEAQTATLANTRAQAIDSLVSGLYSAGFVCAALCGAGLETASAAITAFATTVANPPFVSAGYGAGYVTHPRPTQGRGRLALREHEIAAIRIAGDLVSTDPGRTASGALPNVRGVDHDARLEGDAIHDARLSALRSWEPHARGYFVQRQRMLHPVDSDFTSWPFVAVMMVAIRAFNRVAFQLVLDTMRRSPTGTIDARDAAAIEEAGEAEIDRVLGSTQTNIRGTRGHVSAFGVRVNRAVLLPRLEASLSLRPLGYPDDITFTVQFSDEV